MTEKLKSVVKREMAKLPKENQNVINAFGWEKITEEIGKKYLLNEVELNDFQVQTLLILIGLTDPEYYAQSIENEVGTSKDEAVKIIDEVFQKIFTPINNILIENIKKSGKSKNSSWDKNLNFILSNGDYSAFVEERGSITPETTPPTKKIPIKPTISPSVVPPTLADIKANTQNLSNQLELSSRAGTNVPVKPNKMEDIKKTS